jgi:ABC-type antimicrobial peptide transport system ATPase subunit
MIKIHRESIEKAENLTRYAKELEKKIDMIGNQIEEVKHEKADLQEKFSQQFIILNRKYEKVKDEYEENKLNLDNTVREQIRDRNEELQRMLTHSHVLIEEKSGLIQRLRDSIITNENGAAKINEMKELGKQEAELQYEKQYRE